MKLFAKQVTTKTGQVPKDFAYMSPEDGYFDSACQTLRPQPVIDALVKYYHEYNACGGRVKYAWGRQVDEEVAGTRAKVLKLLGKSEREYVCAFTLNTTYGLNLLLGQVQPGQFERIVTSEIEHNSVFLPTLTNAKRLGIERMVLERNKDGALNYKPAQLDKALVVVNSASNIDGRQLTNIRELCDDACEGGGAVILDAAQTIGHNRYHLRGADYDALCFSAHKMYGPSLGVIVIKRSFLERLDIHFVGGGMVQDVQKDTFMLTEDDLPSRLEAGLQDFGGIIALGAAIDWLQKYTPDGLTSLEYMRRMSNQLYEGLKDIPSLHLTNNQPGTVISFYSDKLDAHRLAVFLSEQNIMVRSGYFCCHYYLLHKLKLPPLVRISLGLNNTPKQVDKLLNTVKSIVRNA